MLTKAEQDFRDEVRTWLEEHLTGEFKYLKGKGGTGQENIDPKLLLEWEREMAKGKWLGLNYPHEWGGRQCSLSEQVVFYMAYVESRAPHRIPNMGVTLLGPTLLELGTLEQKERFLPKILSGEEFWCQGYSEPDAGSDLAGVRTKAERAGDKWIINGQKIWTSLAQFSDWCFVLCRTDPDSSRHSGLSYLLVPMDSKGIEIRPIIQITGGDEFNEVFFSDAETEGSLIVGEEGQGWGVAMATLGFERGASTLGQQLSFRQEFDELMAWVKESGISSAKRLKLAHAYEELEIMRLNNMRMLTAQADGVPGPEASIAKLYWSHWHRNLGELMMEIQEAKGMVGGPLGDRYDPNSWQRTFLYSRSHTIYAGSSEIQKNIIAEKVLGLPR